MGKTILNVKVDVEVKRAAQKTAKDIGVPLSTVVNAFLKEFMREKRVEFSAPLVPNTRTKKLLAEALYDLAHRKSGRFSPSFTDAVAMDRWLGE